MKIFYDLRYNFRFWGLERFHPFQANRAKLIKKELDRSGYFDGDNFLEPILNEALILSYLTDTYKKCLRDKDFLAKCLELFLLSIYHINL